MRREFSGCPMVRIWPSYCQGPQVQSLVRELRSHKPSSATTKKIEWKYKVLLSKKEKKMQRWITINPLSLLSKIKRKGFFKKRKGLIYKIEKFDLARCKK